MEENCFYCQSPIDQSIYHASFVHQNEHVEKEMCEHCYQDWLAGIKG